MAGNPITFEPATIPTPVAMLYRPAAFGGYNAVLVTGEGAFVAHIAAPTPTALRRSIAGMSGVPEDLPAWRVLDFKERPWEQPARVQGGTYAPRPAEVEARRFTAEGRYEVERWAKGRVRGLLLPPEEQVLQWDGPDGEEEARIGDWLVRLPSGRLVKHSQEEFDLLYRPA